MVAPTFKKASNTDPGDSSRYGAQDVKYAFDVLDGSHATDRIQASVIEGLIQDYDVIVYVIGTTIYARRANGVLITSGTLGTNDTTVIQAAIDIAQTDGKAVLAIRAGTYTLNASLTPRDNLTILAYGATFFCSGGSAGFNVFSGTAAGQKKNIKIYGLTIDFNLHAGSFRLQGEVTTTEQVTDILLQDCVFKKPYNGGGSPLLRIQYTFVDGALQTKKNERIQLINCVFDGTSNTTSSDLVNIENTRNVYINGCRFINAGSSKRSALMFYGECADCVVIGNAFSENDDATSDIYMRQATGIRIQANSINTRVTIVDSRYVTVSFNRMRILQIADDDDANYDAHTSLHRGSEHLTIEGNFFNALPITMGGTGTIGSTTDKNIIFDLAGNNANPPKRISIVGNHVIANRMFIDFTGAAGTVSNQVEKVVIASNSIAQNSGTSAASASDGGLIRLTGAANWTTGGFKDVLITGNYFSLTDQGTLPNDITLGQTTFSNVVIRDNFLNNAGISNVNSYPTTISKNFGVTNSTRFANSGTVNITGTNTTATVTHGVGYTPLPQHIFITPTTTWFSTTKFFVDPASITSTQFVITASPAPGAGNTLTFAWQVARRV